MRSGSKSTRELNGHADRGRTARAGSRRRSAHAGNLPICLGCLPSGSEQPELLCLHRGYDQLGTGGRGEDLGSVPLLPDDDGSNSAPHSLRYLLGPNLPRLKQVHGFDAPGPGGAS
jgi:hypothetical protein